MLGYSAGYYNTTGDSQTFIGSQAGLGLDANKLTGHNNTLVGYKSGFLLQGASTQNVIIGALAGDAATTPDTCTLIGYQACGDGVLTGNQNVVIGGNAGLSMTGGYQNTIVGNNAGDALTDGNSNTAIGMNTLSSDVNGHRNVAVGHGSLFTQSFATGTDVYNVAVGYDAGVYITSGVNNTLVGGQAGTNLTDADSNVAIGRGALITDEKGNKSVAVGQDALYAQRFTTSTDGLNTAVGFGAGSTISTGTQNTFVGALAGDGTNDGADNVAVGYLALTSNCGDQNTGLGRSALQVTTGGNNVGVGYGAGSGITTGDNCSIVGTNSNPSGDSTHAIALGSGVSVNSNDFTFGKSGNQVTNDFDADADWSRASDERLKKNITDQTLGLNFINDLRTVKYNWKASHELDSTDSQLAHLYKKDEADNEMNTTVTMHNFIAQEVKTALDKAGVSNFGGWKEDEWGVQQVSREML